MLLYKKPFLIIFFLISTNLFAEYEIEINFESGFEFKSQQLLIETLRKTNSKRKIEKVLISEDWIENYEQEYVNKVVALATDTEKLTTIRSSLRKEMEASPLMDHKGFVRELEAAYQAMWEKWCSA